MAKELTNTAKEQVAMALLLLKDWKCEGRFDVEVTLLVRDLADTLDVLKEYEKLISQVPPMKIEPR